MKAVVQRVSQAEVVVEGETTGKIMHGYLILLGVSQDDEEAQAQKLWTKIRKMRIFSDENGKTNLSIEDVKGEVLIVSQFTLCANCKKGNRPSFGEAKNPADAERLYEYFCTLVEEDMGAVGKGVFGADMQVSLVNDGPFTIVLDTEEL